MKKTEKELKKIKKSFKKEFKYRQGDKREILEVNQHCNWRLEEMSARLTEEDYKVLAKYIKTVTKNILKKNGYLK
jgi:hypothetical protein